MTAETQRTTSVLAYDGRGFLAKARNAVTDCGPLVTTPTYSSDGLLYQRQQQALFTGAVTAQTRIFYFAGRPVAQLDGTPSTGTLTYLTADHLGTPILASTGAATAGWSGGFEPFGRDFSNAQGAGIFLRLPGQWDDAVWDNTHFSSGLFYNLNRWYDSGNGRYVGPDPLGSDRGMNLFTYAQDRPLTFVDLDGRKTFGIGGRVINRSDCCMLVSDNDNTPYQQQHFVPPHSSSRLFTDIDAIYFGNGCAIKIHDGDLFVAYSCADLQACPPWWKRPMFSKVLPTPADQTREFGRIEPPKQVCPCK